MTLCSFSFQYISPSFCYYAIFVVMIRTLFLCFIPTLSFRILASLTLAESYCILFLLLLHNTTSHSFLYPSCSLCYSLMLVSRILYYAPPSLLLKHNLLHVYFLLSISPSPRKRKTMGTTFSLCHPMPSFFPFTPTFSFTYSPCIPQQSGTYHFPPSTFVHQAYIPLYPLLLIRHEFNKFSSLTLTSCYSLSYLFLLNNFFQFLR